MNPHDPATIAFLGGAKAALRADPRIACTFDHGDPRRGHWMRGWFLTVEHVMSKAPTTGQSKQDPPCT
jgi:hypothetical protein